MKKWILLLLIGVMMLAVAGCGDRQEENKTEEPTAVPETQLHTVPPTEEAPQIEWAPVDCEIALESSEYVYFDQSGFLTFALIGNTDDDCALRFALSEDAAAMMTEHAADTEYYLTVNKKVLKGTVTFNDDYTELTLSGGYSYGEMCELAREIRGL